MIDVGAGTPDDAPTDELHASAYSEFTLLTSVYARPPAARARRRPPPPRQREAERDAQRRAWS